MDPHQPVGLMPGKNTRHRRFAAPLRRLLTPRHHQLGLPQPAAVLTNLEWLGRCYESPTHIVITKTVTTLTDQRVIQSQTALTDPADPARGITNDELV